MRGEWHDGRGACGNVADGITCDLGADESGDRHGSGPE
jgi:hypothetical protein